MKINRSMLEIKELNLKGDFYSPEELFDLTGFSRSSRQIQFLKERKIKYLLNGRGHVVVLRKHGEKLFNYEGSH